MGCLPDIAAKPSDGAYVKRELVNLGASVELPQLHRVLHIVHVAGDQLVPCHTCCPLQHILPFLLSANYDVKCINFRHQFLLQLVSKLDIFNHLETHFNQIHPIGLRGLFQVNGNQSVVLGILVGVEYSLGPLVGHIVVVGVKLGDDLCQGELALDPLLAGGLLLQVSEVEQVVLAVL